jgi:hypothetical protein
MDGPHQKSCETFARRAALPRAVVLVVALIGIDCAIPASAAGDRVHRTPAVALRSVSPSSPAALTGAAGIATLALMLMLLFGGQQLDPAPLLRAVRTITIRGDSAIGAAVRRRYSISYRSGGRYGP